mgnify:CR=1 FL=1
MDLYQWLWKNRVKKGEFAKKLGISPQSLSTLIYKKYSPALRVATGINKLSNGEVTMEDMLTDNDRKELQELGLL